MTQLHARVLRQLRNKKFTLAITNTVVAPKSRSAPEGKQKAIDLKLGRHQDTHHTKCAQFDTTLAFLNHPDPSYQTTVQKVFHQCMNGFTTPPHPMKHTRSPVNIRSQPNQSKRPRRTFSPIIVPGTPDQDESSYSYQRSICHTTKHENDETDDELEDIDLYYKIWSQNRPDPDESNAEAAARHQTIDDDYQRLKKERSINKTQS
jgi:hypothetical protein